MQDTTHSSFSEVLFSEQDQKTLEQIMRLRRDVRGNRFTSQDVSNKDLEKILDAGLMAPSVGFSQPWRFVIIREAKTKLAVADIFSQQNALAADKFADTRRSHYQQLKLEGIKEAPINIAVFYQASPSPVLGQNSMPEVGTYSVVCAIQNMWLMARALNLGMGWVSIIDPRQVAGILGAGSDQQLVA